MFGWLTGKTRRNEARIVANETRRAQEDDDRRRKERAQRKKLELQEQILKLGKNYNIALTQKNNSSNTIYANDDAIKITSLETDIKTLEDIINTIQLELEGKVNELTLKKQELTLKKQELTQLQKPYNERKSQKGKLLDKLKEEILKREIHLNSKYGYNYHTQRNKEELNSGQYWARGPSPEELSLKSARASVTTPNNVKKIINKYKIKSPNTSVTATRVNNTTSGGKRNNTLKRK